MQRAHEIIQQIPVSPLLSSLVQSVEAEEKVIETIISCVAANDSHGVFHAASELMAIRSASIAESCVG